MGDTPGAVSYRIDHAEAPRRNGIQIVAAETCTDAGVAHVNPRSRTPDHDRLGHAGEREHDVALQRRARADADDVRHAMRRESRGLDRDRVVADGQRGEAQLALLVVFVSARPPMSAVDPTRTARPQ